MADDIFYLLVVVNSPMSKHVCFRSDLYRR